MNRRKPVRPALPRFCTHCHFAMTTCKTARSIEAKPIAILRTTTPFMKSIIRIFNNVSCYDKALMFDVKPKDDCQQERIANKSILCHGSPPEIISPKSFLYSLTVRPPPALRNILLMEKTLHSKLLGTSRRFEPY